MSDRVVVGTVTGFEQRQGGWRRYSISEPGRQYPVKADTKKPEIIAQVDAYMATQSMVAVQINEADSGNPNPHKPGTNYINRYLNAIAIAAPGQTSEAQTVNALGTAAAATAPVNGQPQVGTQMVQTDALRREKEKELRIMRGGAMHDVTAMVVAGKVPYDPAEMVRVAEIIVAYQVFGAPRFGVAAYTAGLAEEVPYEPPALTEQPGPDPGPDPAEDQAPVPGWVAETVVCPECGGKDEVHVEGCSRDIPF